MTAKSRSHSSEKLSAFNDAPTQAADWVIHEFARVQLPDERLRHRLHVIATAFAQKPTAPIPQACANPAEAKAAYRFVENERIDACAMCGGHEQATVDRARDYPVVLAIQDTTTLNYTTHPKTQGLGPIGTHSKNIGLLLHATLAVTPKGQPLGFVHSCVRRRRGRGRAAQRHRKPLAQKESYKWIESLQACQRWASECPQTQWVNISDREGDIYELLAQAQNGPLEGRVAVLVRSRSACSKRRPAAWSFAV